MRQIQRSNGLHHIRLLHLIQLANRCDTTTAQPLSSTHPVLGNPTATIAALGYSGPAPLHVWPGEGRIATVDDGLMDDQIPHTDPTDSPSSINVLQFWEDPILDHAHYLHPPHDPSPSNGPSPLPLSFQNSHLSSEPLDPNKDCLLWDPCNNLIPTEDGTNTPLGLTSIRDGSIVMGGNPETLNVDHVTSGPSLNWAPHDQLNCDRCQVLREVIHSNGIDTTKLEIHGTVGHLDHAIIEVVQYSVNGVAGVDRRLIDFSMETFEGVKQYLIGYGQMREREGFAVVKDSICDFYDAMCIGMNGGDAICDDPNTFIQPVHLSGFDDVRPLNSVPCTGMDGHAIANPGLLFKPVDPTGSGEIGPPDGAPCMVLDGSDAISNPTNALLQTVEKSGQLRAASGERSFVELSKGGIAEQRERTRKLKLKDLVGHFHLPIQVASKRLSVCSTVLKKICRRNGLKRWPYRKVKSLDRRINTLQKICGGDESLRAEIERLRNERAQICAGISGKD